MLAAEVCIYAGHYISICEIDYMEIWLEKVAMSGTGLANREIWFCKALTCGDMGSLKQSFSG